MNDFDSALAAQLAKKKIKDEKQAKKELRQFKVLRIFSYLYFILSILVILGSLKEIPFETRDLTGKCLMSGYLFTMALALVGFLKRQKELVVPSLIYLGVVLAFYFLNIFFHDPIHDPLSTLVTNHSFDGISNGVHIKLIFGMSCYDYMKRIETKKIAATLQ